MNKTIKCLISLMLVFSMIFTTMVGSVSAALTVADIVDVEDPQFDIVHLLVKLGVFKEGDEFPASMSESITRAEFVEYAMRLCRYNDIDVSDTYELRYTDVDSSHKYYKTILLAAALNVLTYDEYDLTFKPDDYITFDEGLAVVINALGYKEYAMHTGEYPASYRVLASNLDLYDSLDSANNDGIMTYETACQLLYNAFVAPLFEVASTSTTTGETFWEINENKSVLSEKHGIYQVEGILTANDVASIIPGVSAERGTARIGNQLYYNVNTDEAVYDYLGYNVKAFYTEEDGRKELVYVGTIGKKNEIFTLAAEDISEVRKSGSNVIISYWDENDNIDTITITPSTSVLFNDKAYDSPVIYKEWFLVKNGEIVFLNNGGTNEYDVAFIYEYNTTVVDSVNVENKYIYDIDDTTLNVDLNHSTNTFYYSITDENGKKLELSDLKPGYVLSVAQSADRRVTKMKVSTESGNQIISAKDAGERKVTIGTKDYDVGERVDMTNLLLGEQVTVYFDVFGNVAYVEKVSSTSGKSIAYLVSMDRSGRSSLSRNIDVLLVKSKDDETSVFRLAETITLDGEKVKSFTLFTDASHLSLFDAGNSIKQQVISYSVNDKNEIDYIDTQRLGAEEDPEETLTIRHTLSDSALYLKSGYMATKGSANIKFAYSSSKSTVFYIPTDPTAYDSFESNAKSLVDESEKKYDVYTMGNVSVVPIAFVLQESSGSSAGAIDEYAVPHYLEKIVYTVYKNKDGEEDVGRKICLMDTDAKSKSVILPTENETLNSATKWSSSTNLKIGDAVALLGVGDILVYAEDSDGYMNNIQVLYDWDANAVVTGATYTPNSNAYQGLRAYHFGQVYHKESGYYSISPNTSVLTDTDLTNDSTLQIKPFPLSESATVNIFNVENGKLTYKAGTKKDVIDYKTYGDEATLSFVNARYASPQKKLFFKNHTGVGSSTDANYGKYPAYFVESETVTSVKATLRADAGQTITIPGDCGMNISGYKFMGWNDGMNTYVAGSSYTMPEATVIFYPVWSVANNTTFTAGVHAGATTGEAPSLGKFVEGETFTLPANTFNIMGYKFVGWNDGTSTYAVGDTYTMPATDVTFEAQWVTAFTATFVGGTGTSGTAPTYIGGLEGDVITLPANTFAKTALIGSYTFTGWSADGGVTVYQPGDRFTMPASNVQFTAQWDFSGISEQPISTMNSAYVILDNDTADGGTGRGNPTDYRIYYNSSQRADLQGGARSNQWYDAWYLLGIDLGEIPAVSKVTLKLPAYRTKFGPLTLYKVTNGWDGATSFGGATLTNGLNEISGSSITMPTLVQIGSQSLASKTSEYTVEFDVTSYINELKNNGATKALFAMQYALTTNHSDSVKGASNAYQSMGCFYTPFEATESKRPSLVVTSGVPVSVNFDGNGAESGSVSAINTIPGTEVTLPANGFVKEGYEFLGWSADGNEPVLTNPYTVPDTATTLKAVWKPMIKFTFESGRADATTNAGAQTVYYGTTGNRLELPACMFNVSGCVFSGWKEGTTTYTVGTPITFDSNKTFTATWIEAKAATFDTGVAPISALPGEDITLPAMTGKVKGKIFDGWHDGTAKYQPGDDYEMPANGVTFTSVWVDGVAIDFTYATKSDFETVALNDKIILPNTSDKTGYTFEGWTADNGTTILPAGSEYTVATTGVTLKAVYTKDLEFTQWYFRDPDGKVKNGTATLGRSNGSYFYTTLDISGVDCQMLKANFGFMSAFHNAGSCTLRIKPVTGDYSTVFAGIAAGQTSSAAVDISALTVGSDIATQSISSSREYKYRQYSANLAPYIAEQKTAGKTSVQLAFTITGGTSHNDLIRNKTVDGKLAFVKIYVIADASAL